MYWLNVTEMCAAQFLKSSVPLCLRALRVDRTEARSRLPAPRAVASWTSSLQGSSVQLLRLSRKGRAANKHDSATGQGSAVFRVVMDRMSIWTETSSPKDGVRLTTWEAMPKETQVADVSFWCCS